MKTNAEIRKEAWRIVRGKWFWRIFTSGAALYGILLVVSALVARYYSDGNIQTWSEFLQAKVRALQAGLGYDVPSRRVFWQMTGASVFQQFMSCLFGSILLFGMAGLMLKAVRNEEEGWFAGSFGGFRRPLELTWLMVLMNLRIFLWGLLLVVPGIVATYRYRQAWYLKNEHPDWRAGQCLAESGALMKGHKGQAFRLDLFFAFCWFVPCALVLGISGVGLSSGKDGSVALGLVGGLVGLVGFYFFVFVLAYFCVARTVFYRELPRACAHDI